RSELTTFCTPLGGLDMNRLSRTLSPGLVAACVVGLGTPTDAATFVAGDDPTTTFSNLLLDDVTPNTGQDTGTATVFGPQRDLAITTGTGPQTVSITGIALNPRGGTATTLETVTVTVQYLGADATFNTADDVLLGSETATLQYLGTVDQYTAVFDNPIVGDIDAVENRFRFLIESTGNLRFKQWNAGQAPSGEGGLKLSVGGTSVPVPEPSSLALLGLGALACMRRRRSS
ncbi:MAG: PEP-CTERM sorting domain-containing protein, partial [Planctomycetota bacterium]